MPKTKKKLKKVPKKSTEKRIAKAPAKKVAKAVTKPVKKAKVAAKAKVPKVPSKKVVAKSPPPKVKPVKELKQKKGAAALAEVILVEETVEVIVEPQASEEVFLTDAEGRRYCRVKDCDQLASVDIYCRYHYLLYWKKIQVRKKILTEGKLERYIEDLTARYPDKFLDMLRKDLRSEKEFLAAIQELEIDESQSDDFEDENENFIEEVRGMSEPVSRDEEDF